MAFGAIAGFVGRLAPKVIGQGIKAVGGKSGKEMGTQFFTRIGKEAGEKGGKKLFSDTVTGAMKGDKSAFNLLKGMGGDLLKIPGMNHGIIKTVVDMAFQGLPGGRAAGSFVSKFLGFKPDSALGAATKTLD